MEAIDRDCWYGVVLHSSGARQEAIVFFRQKGEDRVVVVFSRMQSNALLDRLISCFKPGEKDRVSAELNDSKSLPKSSRHDPIVIDGTAADTLCLHYRNYERLTPSDREEWGYDNVRPRVIAYLYSSHFYIKQSHLSKSTIIAVKDRHGKYHVYIVFSDEEARRVLELYPEARPDMEHYFHWMALSPLPPSNLPTIHLGGDRGGVAARALCIFIEVPRWLKQLTDADCIPEVVESS